MYCVIFKAKQKQLWFLEVCTGDSKEGMLLNNYSIKLILIYKIDDIPYNQNIWRFGELCNDHQI